jgi:hypothetical protein
VKILLCFAPFLLLPHAIAAERGTPLSSDAENAELTNVMRKFVFLDADWTAALKPIGEARVLIKKAQSQGQTEAADAAGLLTILTVAKSTQAPTGNDQAEKDASLRSQMKATLLIVYMLQILPSSSRPNAELEKLKRDAAEMLKRLCDIPVMKAILLSSWDSLGREAQRLGMPPAKFPLQK